MDLFQADGDDIKCVSLYHNSDFVVIKIFGGKLEITIKLPDHGNMKSNNQVDILENDCCEYIYFVQGISIRIDRQ